MAALALLVGVLAAGGAGPGGGVGGEEALWHHRNLGKAFYENPTTQGQAVEELKKALELAPESARERLNYGLALLKAGKTAEGVAELERVQKQDPKLPHTWFNLGIAWKRAAEYERAIAQFERLAEMVPDEPVTHYNLGVLYKLTGKGEAAVGQFETAARLDPRLAGPHFQLFNVYRQGGKAAEAARELATFQEIKKQQAGAAVPEDLEWSFYSEIYDPIEPQAGAGEQGGAAAPRFADRELARGLDTPTAGLLVLDADGDGRPDLLAWSVAGVRLFRSGSEPVTPSGLEQLNGVVGVAAGDFDNDGLADLCVLTTGGARLFRNTGGKFKEVPARLPAGRFRKAVWLDYDHDYDLDLILLGDGAALVRNDGAAGWSDHTADFPFVPGHALDAAVFDLIADTQGLDLAVSYTDRPGVLYRDRLGGRFTAEPLPALPAGARALAAGDLDGDGWTDLVAAAGAGGTAALLLNRRGRLEAAPAPAGLAAPLALADLGNRGLADLVSAAGISGNRGLGRFGPIAAQEGFPIVAVASADFDGDGREDLAVVRGDGTLHLLRNAAGSANRWLGVGLAGVRNPKLAPGARVEVKAGSLYQKKLYWGTPLVFGLGAGPSAGPAAAAGGGTVDTVRITWPNGLIQNEMKQAAGRATVYKEAQRLSGSCPMIFTWNGSRFEFITDVLGVAPLGASSGDGKYFPVDHEEYVSIPGGSLAEQGGQLEIRVTEELREVTYLDHVRLLVLDHPAGLDVFTNEKFKSPPFPEFRLFGAERRIYPRRASDDHGRDILPALLRRDGVYPDGFRRTPSGIAEMHAIELDFGAAAPDNRAVLLASGWVDWADGSTFLAASQESAEGLMLPRLEVRDAAGRWQTVVADMGIPAGKPKTIAVDLTGKFLSASREIRIVTNLCVYWDEIFLSESAAAPRVRLRPLPLAAADLRFRGFSRPVIDPERKQPEAFDYGDWMPLSGWNPTPGLYTRYGDVRDLLERVDDRLVIMGSGDELRLRFAARGLPPLPPGWKRDFLLDVDGWAKDGDANTAYSQSVEPLPFHAMSQYPYAAPEHFPDDAAHRRWRELYNRRPALCLLRPLRPSEGVSKDAR
ncbi:MAG TPA: FG-GAP-like repeat-containing protein [Thermoanaerobaculia bacterium]|nr:FG-GAP-like repeat-containing protein [Thermoanaerobaculia bacterium]